MIGILQRPALTYSTKGDKKMPTKKKTWSEGSTYTIGRILRPVGGLTKKPHTKILDTQLRNKRTLKNDLKDQVVEKLRSSLDIYIPHNLKPIEKSFFFAS